MNAIISNKDEMVMSLVHYFVTEEDYVPISVQGANNEIWLENLEKPYKIVRINSGYIHNNEQYNLDLFKIRFVLKQIKKKTLSFKMNVLNICLDLGNSVNIKDEDKTINTVNVTSISDIKENKFLGNIYPKIKTNSFKKSDDLDKIINITNDINKKTVKENSKYEDVFKPKPIIVTKILIVFCTLLYFFSVFYTNSFVDSVIYLGANGRNYILNGEYYRLFTNIFLHGSLIHLIVNMYSLWIIGSQVETYIGKWKFLIIFLLSGFMGSLFSVIFLEDAISLGASGAIFGLMGSLLYFGYHYRLYLSNTLTNQLIPIIVLNLILGFTLKGIDNAAHIGGLVGGYLSTMFVGLKYKSSKSERINGLIVYVLLVVFLFYVTFSLL